MSERIQAITMPRWGMTMTEGIVASWLVPEGATLAADQEVVEIETTKITNVMEAGRPGVLRRIVAAPGTVAPVGALLAVLADSSVPDAEIDAFIAERRSELQAEAGVAVPQARMVEANGRRINVLAMGDGDAIPMVLIHGFGGDLNTWLFNQEALAVDRPVYAIDLPAHGGSDPDVGAGDLAALADAVEAALDALGADPVHVAGHSLGGAVALALAERRPGRVRSLPLIAPAGLGPAVGENYIEAFLAADGRREVKDVLGKLFADPNAVSRDMINGVQRFKRLDGVPDALRRLADQLFPEGRQTADLRPVLAGLNIPVLIIQGERDRIMPAVAAGEFGPHVRLETIPDAGHMPMMEAAASVNRLIAALAAETER